MRGVNKGVEKDLYDIICQTAGKIWKDRRLQLSKMRDLSESSSSLEITLNTI